MSKVLCSVKGIRGKIPMRTGTIYGVCNDIKVGGQECSLPLGECKHQKECNQGISVQALLLEVQDHDKPVLELLQSKSDGYTFLQIAQRLKRGMTDVKHSIHNLVIAKKVSKTHDRYGRWSATA